MKFLKVWLGPRLASSISYLSWASWARPFLKNSELSWTWSENPELSWAYLATRANLQLWSEGFSVQIARQLWRSTMLPAHAPWWQLSQETLYVFKKISFSRNLADNLDVKKMKTFWYELKNGNRKHGAHRKSHTKSHKVAVPLFIFDKMEQQADFTCRNENCCPNNAYRLECQDIN